MRKTIKLASKNYRMSLLEATATIALACGLWSGQTNAQSIGDETPPSIDENGVDLINGQFSYSNKINSISAGPTLTYDYIFSGDTLDTNHPLWRTVITDNYPGNIVLRQMGSGPYVVGADYKYFYTTGSPNTTYTSSKGDKSYITWQGVDEYLYVTENGDKITFKQYQSTRSTFITSRLTKIVKADGEVISITHRLSSSGSPVGIQTISSSLGYILQFSYNNDNPSQGGYSTISSVNAYNKSTDNCQDGAYHCPAISGRPTLSFSYSIGSVNITNSSGITSKYYKSGNKLAAMIGDDYANNIDTISAVNAGVVSSVTKGGQTWNYSRNYYNDPSTGKQITNTTVLDPTGRSRQYAVTPTYTNPTYPYDGRRLQSVTDGVGGTTIYGYDTLWRLSRVTYPEGNYVQLSRDSNANITEVRRVSKTPNTPADLVETFTFPSSCANLITCHKPTSTTDALGNQTDYTYHPTHGGVLTATKPAATYGDVRPQQRFAYTPLQAYFLIGGSLSASGQTIYKLTETSTCRTLATCSGTSDETKTTIDYGPQTPGVGNNLLPVASTSASGDGAVSLTTSIGYDAMGRQVSADGPLPGNADATYSRYDASGRLIGTIGVDPDGGDSLPRVAERYTYDGRGNLNRTEIGTVADDSDTSWSGFSTSHYQQVQNDSLGRPLRSVTSAASTDFAERDYLYDAAGRVACTIDRMVPSSAGALPTNCAPTQTASADGPDRVTQLGYDAAGRLTTKQSGVGTSMAITETTAYTLNGKVAYVVDANSNRTTYEYDGHDRLVIARFPVSTLGSNVSSTTDIESIIYGDNVNVTEVRLRDYTTTGSKITATYDNLGRVMTRTPAGEATVNYTYDLQNNMTSIQRPGDGMGISYSRGVLGRLTEELQPFGSSQFQYDSYGRLNRLTWSDGFYVNYDYDFAGRVTDIRENGATSGLGKLATYSYDVMGRRANVAYGNGSSRSFGYDAIGRLAGVQIDLVGTASDLLIGKVGASGTAIEYNPAGQIRSISRNNDTYAYTGRYNVNRSYSVNGLNQYASAGGTSFTFDGRGNLTGSGPGSYLYNRLNQLVEAPNQSSPGSSVTLRYDGSGRMVDFTAGSSTRLVYAGRSLTNEVNASGTVLRRYVPGPGMDELVVWYEGSGTTDRRWLQTDERGSVVAVSDTAGAAIAINRYDEYGIPQANNLGRFQYTGQTWFAEAGLYNYKARMYSPSLGRFMQTDPTGYRDGLNWYNYVGSDPINNNDPSGLSCNSVIYSNYCTASDYASEDLVVYSKNTTSYFYNPLNSSQGYQNTSQYFNMGRNSSGSYFNFPNRMAPTQKNGNFYNSNYYTACQVATFVKDRASEATDLGLGMAVFGGLGGGIIGASGGPGTALAGAAAGAGPGLAFAGGAGAVGSVAQFGIDATQANSPQDWRDAGLRLGIGLVGGHILSRMARPFGFGGWLDREQQLARNSAIEGFGGEALSRFNNFMDPKNGCY